MLVNVECPFCGKDCGEPWAEERKHKVVRCDDCDFLYLNPRPNDAAISSAVSTGIHSDDGDLNVRSRYQPRRVQAYRRTLGRMFADCWGATEPIHWLDVGCGYGEILEAVQSLAPVGSKVEGVEPMQVKADHAKARGLSVSCGYLGHVEELADFVSIVDVFSHVPSFDDFLQDVRGAVRVGGSLFIETGNLADVKQRSDFPGELGLPDHLCFGGERHIIEFLRRNGFVVKDIDRVRVDDLMWTIKNLAKRALGRPALMALPYRSSYRSLRIRAQAI